MNVAGKHGNRSRLGEVAVDGPYCPGEHRHAQKDAEGVGISSGSSCAAPSGDSSHGRYSVVVLRAPQEPRTRWKLLALWTGGFLWSVAFVGGVGSLGLRCECRRRCSARQEAVAAASCRPHVSALRRGSTIVKARDGQPDGLRQLARGLGRWMTSYIHHVAAVAELSGRWCHWISCLPRCWP